MANGSVCAPADRLADGYEEILSLLRDWGEGLQDDMTVLGTNPNGPSGVVRFQVKPREVVLLEDVRD